MVSVCCGSSPVEDDVADTTFTELVCPERSDQSLGGADKTGLDLIVALDSSSELRLVVCSWQSIIAI